MTAEEQGPEAESRVPSPDVAWELAQAIIDDDAPRASKRAIVDQFFAGNPPYSNAELQRINQGWRANFNSLLGDDLRARRMSSYVELTFNVGPVASIRIDDNAASRNRMQPEERDRLARVIATKFDRMVRDWDGFAHHTLLMQSVIVKYARSSVYWPDEVDWRWRAGKLGDVLFSAEATAVGSELDVVVIRDTMLLTDFYRKVIAPERKLRAQEQGWNTALALKIVQDIVKDRSEAKRDNLTEEDIVALAKQWEIVESYKQKAVPINHLLIREYSGKVTQIIMPANESQAVLGYDGSNRPKRQWLFRKIGRFADFPQCCQVFIADVGDGPLHSIKGLGQKLTPQLMVGDRLNCQAVDAAILSNSILLENVGAKDTALRLLRLGPITAIPSGFRRSATGDFKPNMEAAMLVANRMEAKVARLAGVMGDPAKTKSADDPTTFGQARMEAAESGRIEAAELLLFYACWDRMWAEVLRRVLNPLLLKDDPGGKEAMKFRRDCKDAGVPGWALQSDVLSIKATRALGQGSPIMRKMIANDVLGASPYLPGRGKQNAVEDWVEATAGSEFVDRYTGQGQQPPHAEVRIVTLEQNDLDSGQRVPVLADDDHLVHLGMQMRPLLALVGAYAKQQLPPDPATATRMQAMLEHNGGHADYIAEDPARKREYQQVETALKQAAPLVQQYIAQVEKLMRQQQQEAQARQQEAAQMQTDAALEARRQDIDAELKARKAQVDVGLKAERSRAATQIKREAARAQTEIQREKAGLAGQGEAPPEPPQSII